MSAFTLFNELTNCKSSGLAKKILIAKRNTRDLYQVIQKNDPQYKKLKIFVLENQIK